MAKKIVVIMIIMSFSMVLHGMEFNGTKPKKKSTPRFSLPLSKSNDSAVTKDTLEKDTLKKNDSGKVLSAKNGKRSIRSLSASSELKSAQEEYRVKTMSSNRRDESSSLNRRDGSSEKK